MPVKRNFDKTHQRAVVQSKGFEDVRGGLPSGLPRGPFRPPRVSKIDLRREAERALEDWRKRRRP